MDKMFEGRKSKFVVGVFVVVVLALVMAFAWQPAEAQTPVITQEEVDKAVENATAKVKAEFEAQFASLLKILMPLVEKYQQQEQVQVEQPILVEQAPRAVEVVETIRQVGGGSQIIQDWNNEAAVVVSIPILKDLKWEGIHNQDGMPLYLIALSSDKGTVTYQAVEYVFDKGFVGVFITSDPLSVIIQTDWNGSAEDPKDRHYNVWSELFVVSEDLDIEETAERLLSEWLEEQGKDIGFMVDLSGQVSKMKYQEAELLNTKNDPLFPKQLPQTPAGQKAVIMTVSQVGSGSPIITDWKNPEAGVVTMPSEDANNWEGILKNDGKPVYLVLVSSDPGSVKFGSAEKTFKQGFVAAFITDQPDSISLSTGWNDQSGHFNIWSEKFVVPEDEDIDTVLKQKLAEWKKSQGKTISFAILSDGVEFNQ